MKLIDILKTIILGSSNEVSLRDPRLWLLLIVINCGANMGFNYYFEQQAVKILLFFVCLFLIYKHKSYRPQMRQISFVAILSFILFFQVIYLSAYSLSTSIHYMVMIAIAVMTVSITGKLFARYFASIMFVYAVISLVCYTLSNVAGVVIPYIPITESNIDGGVIMRVYNLYYTQLGNPMGAGAYTIRNCGPFWEPGAFQGFLNLSLFFELTYPQVRDNYWKFRIIVLIVSVLTTLSTGGYVVLFFILGAFFLRDKHISSYRKMLLLLSAMVIFLQLYHTLDFLGSKIAADEERLKFSFTDFPNPMYMLFGYGYSPESFRYSSMVSSSSVFNLFRYMGIIGFLVYMVALCGNHTPFRFVYAIVVSLILMNEPFLSNAMIWWGIAFVTYDLNRNQKILSTIRNI